MTAQEKEIFEFTIRYLKDHNVVPLSFILAFFVNIVTTKWRSQHMELPTIDSVTLYVSAAVTENNERNLTTRKTIIRYASTSQMMILSEVVPKIKKRFPSISHFVCRGLLHKSERDILDRFDKQYPKIKKPFILITWAVHVIIRAKQEGQLRVDFAEVLIKELNKFRIKCSKILRYQNTSIPLAYSQVIFIAAYLHLYCTLISEQSLEIRNVNMTNLNVMNLNVTNVNDTNSTIGASVDSTLNEAEKWYLSFPFYAIAYFIFNFSWLRIAEESLFDPISFLIARLDQSKKELY